MFRKLQLHQPCSLCCPPNLLQCPGERAQLWGCCRDPEVKPHFGVLGTWARSSFGCSALGETGMSRNCAAALQCRWAAECPCQGALFSLNEVLWLNTRPLVSSAGSTGNGDEALALLCPEGVEVWKSILGFRRAGV